MSTALENHKMDDDGILVINLQQNGGGRVMCLQMSFSQFQSMHVSLKFSFKMGLLDLANKFSHAIFAMLKTY